MRARLQSFLSPLWISLQYREQLALLVGGLSLLAFVAYIGIARPLVAHKEATARQLDAQEARFERIVGLFARLEPAEEARPDTATGEDVRATVLALAQEAGITIDRIQSGEQRFTLFVNTVSPANAFGWLNEINNRLSVQPISVNMRKAGDGLVTAQIGFATQDK